jgi:hypothetical protein
MDYSYTDPAVTAFAIIPVLLAAALVWGARAAWRRSGAPPSSIGRVSILTVAGAAAWMAAAWLAADSGVLRQWERNPPPFALLVVAIVAVATGIAFSGFGGRLAQFLPLWMLVGIQAFRLPLELAMHTMAERGIMPELMSYSGRNFDILTGASAIVVAALARAGRGGRTLVLVWNIAGLALLVNVVVIAVLMTPRFRYFGDEQLNVWVTYPPFVWLPAVMVLAALAGHLLIFRALRSSR